MVPPFGAGPSLAAMDEIVDTEGVECFLSPENVVSEAVDSRSPFLAVVAEVGGTRAVRTAG